MSGQPQLSFKQIIANNLNYLMKVYGKSRKEVCDDLNLKYTTYTDWLKGNTYPKLDTLEQLAYYFRLDTRDLLIEIPQNPNLVNRVANYAQHLGVHLGTDEKSAFTVTDYYETPEGYPVELIRGKFFVGESPSLRHQSVVSELLMEIRSHIRKNHGNCKVFPGPIDVELPVREDTVVVPDLIVVCDSSKLNAKGCKGAPDWIIEVLSPSTTHKDHREKLSVYEEAGVREYWMIDPEKHSVEVYLLQEESANDSQTPQFDDVINYSYDDNISAKCIPGLSVCFSEMDLWQD